MLNGITALRNSQRAEILPSPSTGILHKHKAGERKPKAFQSFF